MKGHGYGVLVLRADSGPLIGTGHVMRCLALAQAWQDEGGSALFLTADGAGIALRLNRERVAHEPVPYPLGSDADAQHLARRAIAAGARWVVVDGYHFSPRFHRRLKEAGLRLLVIDDGGKAGAYDADLVLDQNLGALAEAYADRRPDTRLLLGPAFALLRREFREFHDRQDRRREIPEVARRVLVTFGGTTHAEVTLCAVVALHGLNDPSVNALVLTGGDEDELAELAGASSGSATQIELSPRRDDLPAVMAGADLSLAAAGSSTWERAMMGLPGLLVAVAENQRPIARACHGAGLACDLGVATNLVAATLVDRLRWLIHDRSARTAMARRGQQLVDGEGVERLLGRMEPHHIRLRPAVWSDARTTWEWSNSPTVRAASFHTEPILLEQHLDWFEERLADPACCLFVAELGEGVPCGQARIEIKGREAVISVSVDRTVQGRGYGRVLIRKACRNASRLLGVGAVHAYVREDNASSLSAFSAAGFEVRGLTQINGHAATRLVLPLDTPATGENLL